MNMKYEYFIRKYYRRRCYQRRQYANTRDEQLLWYRYRRRFVFRLSQRKGRKSEQIQEQIA